MSNEVEGAEQETREMLQPGTEIITETSRGLMRGLVIGRSARGVFQIMSQTGRIYPVRRGRYVEITPDTPTADFPALYVAGIYSFTPCGDHVQCSHPEDPKRSYPLQQDLTGAWSCTCRAFDFSSMRGDGTCKHLQALALRNHRIASRKQARPAAAPVAAGAW